MSRRLEFWFDVVCPYAYLASTQIERIAQEAGAELVIKPVLLGGLYKHWDAPQNPGSAMAPARARMDLLDRERQARHFGVPLEHNPLHPVRSVYAMRLVLAAQDHAWDVARDLFTAYHVDGEDISNDDVLERIAARHGLDVGVVREDRWRQALFDAVAEGADKGIFGVPAMFVDDGPLVWGADQLHFVEEELDSSPAAPRSPGTPGQVVRFFHDFSSPYSYLGATQIEAMAARQGAELQWKPMLLGALFKSIGTPIVPIATFHERKQRWNLQNLQRWAAHWDVPFRFPSHFPFRTVTALRVALIEPAVTPHIYRAGWAEDRNIGDDEELVRILDEAGFDGTALVAGTRDPAIKERLKDNTAAAEQLGCCGAPSTVVGDQVFWGQDRLWMAEALLSEG